MTGSTKAYAVFHEHGSHCLSGLLHPDFQHVFVLIPAETMWIMVDGRDGCVVIDPVSPLDFDIKNFYEEQGFTVVAVEKRDVVSYPMTITNCVGMAKVVLGINAPWIFTPYQLYRKLRDAPDPPR